MASITFRAKVHTMHDADGTALYAYVEVPKFKRSHCDMGAMRSHRKYGSYANSDLFLGMLDRIRRDLMQGKAYLRLDELPENVDIDTTGFLAAVSIEV